MAKIKKIDKKILFDIKHFFNKVNEKALYQMGYTDSYDDNGEAALAESVEYFHPQITLDDRMAYIAKNIVSNQELTYTNIICNTIISHFYGGRGIHQIMTRDSNPKTALVDFDRMLEDEEYVQFLSNNLNDARALGLPVYGTTELRTSLFGAANNYVAKKYDRERNADLINIGIWVAGFIERGIIDEMYDATSLKQMFSIITKLEGVGSYYGYHCSTSNSVNPEIRINHDEEFCVPGPGARKTLDLLFGKDCEVDYGDRVIWFRKNYKKLIGEIYLHPDTHNIIVDGHKILQDEQDDLKVYGCEVGLCQYGIYHRFKEQPQLINRRKVARVDPELMKRFFGETPKKKVTKPKQQQKPKKKKQSNPKEFSEDKIKLIKNQIKELGQSTFSHNDLAKLIDSKGGLGLKQEGNWKESWAILQDMVKRGLLVKESRNYKKNY